MIVVLLVIRAITSKKNAAKMAEIAAVK